MPDVFDKAKRSQIMRSIRSKNTKAELVVFRHLRRRGVYFQRHYTRVLGSPDIALPRKKKAVFIDGDFWHGKDFDRLLQKHAADSFWVAKISGNMERDRRQRQSLIEMGWTLLAVWETDILRKRTREDVLQKIEDFLVTKDESGVSSTYPTTPNEFDYR